jgi:hypothetical protein
VKLNGSPYRHDDHASIVLSLSSLLINVVTATSTIIVSVCLPRVPFPPCSPCFYNKKKLSESYSEWHSMATDGNVDEASAKCVFDP